MTHILALTGQSGSGKDTLGNLLTNKETYRYTRIAFGDTLRAMTETVYAKPQPVDERQSDYCNLGSFKDAMLAVGSSATLSNPFTLCKLLAKQVNSYEGPYVVTDVRKPIEVLTLQQLSLSHGLPLYLVEVVRTGQPVSDKRLDNLLTQDSERFSKKYAEAGVEAWSQQCDVIASHGTVYNDSLPEDMLSRLSLVLELAVPYNFVGHCHYEK